MVLDLRRHRRLEYGEQMIVVSAAALDRPTCKCDGSERNLARRVLRLDLVVPVHGSHQACQRLQQHELPRHHALRQSAALLPEQQRPRAAGPCTMPGGRRNSSSRHAESHWQAVSSDTCRCNLASIIKIRLDFYSFSELLFVLWLTAEFIPADVESSWADRRANNDCCRSSDTSESLHELGRGAYQPQRQQIIHNRSMIKR